VCVPHGISADHLLIPVILFFPSSRKFGYVDFESAEDLEKALELTGLKVFGNEIKLEKPKGRDSKKGM
jgi:RNA recognition motif-containing protein